MGSPDESSELMTAGKMGVNNKQDNKRLTHNEFWNDFTIRHAKTVSQEINTAGQLNLSTYQPMIPSLDE